jgi:diacylglycerol O-acyltransferase
MPDRLSALDASFLYLEDAVTPMHVGGVAIFERPREGFDYRQVLCLVTQRLAYLPRYRQRVVTVPGYLARPVWADDVDFDLNYHVRRSALPAPGTDEQLFELVARLMARTMDHERPLWEAYFIEGLENDRVALVTKTHQAMVDGVGTVELGQLILDSVPQRCEPVEDIWVPRRWPSTTQLVLDAVSETVRRPGELAENLRILVGDAAATVGKLADTVGGLASVVRTLVRPAPVGPLNQHEAHGDRARHAEGRWLRTGHDAFARRTDGSVVLRAHLQPGDHQLAGATGRALCRAGEDDRDVSGDPVGPEPDAGRRRNLVPERDLLRTQRGP